MELPEIVELARNFSVLVKVNGPDPKGIKMREHAFHQYHSGRTALSASGMLLPGTCSEEFNFVDGEKGSNLIPDAAVVVTVASIIEPFLSIKSKESGIQALPELIPEARVDIMIEEKLRHDGISGKIADTAPKWFLAKVLRLVDVPASALSIQSLVGTTSGSSEHQWELGWSLASHYNPQKFMGGSKTQHEMTSAADSSRLLKNPSLMANATARIAILQVPGLFNMDLPTIMISPPCKRGDTLLAVGSPFGILSPLHFFNSASVGSVSNSYPPFSLDKSLLMADIRCLPGMEGAPVFSGQACLIGLLTRPLRQMGGAEVQLVIPWKSIEAACSDIHHMRPKPRKGYKSMEHNTNNPRTIVTSIPGHVASSNCFTKQAICSPSVPSIVDQAKSSVCLVTLDNGVWASGILLNEHGLILTNAHLLEPWRFRGSKVDSGIEGDGAENLSEMFDGFASRKPDKATEYKRTSFSLSNKPEAANFSHNLLSEGSQSVTNYKGHGRISVRLDNMNPWVWCDAKVVYISKGPLDISLLQLESVPHQLSPIDVNLALPSPGSKAYVIGHGLFGPPCDLFPSICSGVIAKVVRARIPLPYPFSSHLHPTREFPAMLETTAAVHPGGSGGAIVNSYGKMIGLVTSNAKHGGGTVIPHMNFSIPCSAIEAVFKFAKDMQHLSLLQGLDKPNKNLSSIWTMMPLPPETGPSLPGVHDLIRDAQRDNKGSRFAKFIAERQGIFKTSIRPTATEELSRDVIPSKL